MEISFDISGYDMTSCGTSVEEETIVITVASGDPGGNSGEFAEYLRGCLDSWYNGAVINIRVSE